MPVATFAADQPWGSAAQHQRANPGAWTPELTEATAAWTEVVRAIVQAQEELLRGSSKGEPCSFVCRCTEDPKLRTALDLVSKHHLHGLLLTWVMEGVRERLANHAVPSFWRHYRETPGAMQPERAEGRAGTAALQRRCQTSFFAAVHELAGYVVTQQHLIAMLEGQSWHSPPPAPHSFGKSAAAATPGASGSGSSPLGAEVLTMLQSIVLGQAPSAHAFSSWLTLCWQRSVVDIARGGGEGEDEDDVWAEGGEEGEEGDEGDDEDDEDMSRSPSSGAMSVDSASLETQLRDCFKAVHQLGWLPIVEPTLSSMLHVRLHASLLRRCAGRFDEPLLERVLAWLRRGTTKWLRAVLMPTEALDALPSAALQQWLARLGFFLMQSLASLRIKELFDMIVDYPDSLPALIDLKECLFHTHQHQDAVAALAEAIDQRLLIPGAGTADIIKVYVSAIKALRQLDPSGVTLEAVSDRVRTYLKARPDTIRQIVTWLTDPKTSELLEPSAAADGEAELLSAELLVNEDGGGDAELNDLELDEVRASPQAVEAAMLEWRPDPVQADPTRSSARRTADVLSILVNIYGSKALFVNEFRSMLADKLLSASDFDTDRDVRNVELLKKRFGEETLNQCEVMLRDIAESKRTTRSVHLHVGDEACKLVDATIISRLCWPTDRLEASAEERFALPPEVKHEFDRFEASYTHHKAPRKLVWKPTLGCVTLEAAFEDPNPTPALTPTTALTPAPALTLPLTQVAFEDTTVSVKCSPLHATILHAFGTQPRWQLRALATHLEADAETVKTRIVYWVNRGFIHDLGRTADGDVTYEAPSHLGSGGEERQGAVDDEDDGGAAASSALSAAEEREMRVYEQYIIGMLTNLVNLPLSRIHNMIRMFVPSDDKDLSEAELQRFLSRMVEDGKIEVSAGMYKLRAQA